MGKKSLRTSVILLLILSLSSISTNMIRISKAQEIHDIAVISVTPSNTLVESGSLVNITVVVKNQGTESETFNITLYRDAVPIEINRTATDLVAGQNRTLVFTWNTTDTIQEIYALTSKEKSYDVKAVATLLGDTDQVDNTLTSPSKIKVVFQYIAVRPLLTIDGTLTTGKNYTVTIYTDYNGTDIWGWQFSLTFNPAVLKCTEARNGDLITTTKHPDAQFLRNINNTIGRLSAGAIFYYLYPDEPPTTSGPGTLANVTFTVVGTGYSNITLGKDTKLQVYDTVEGEIHEIINEYLPSLDHIFSGYFGNTEVQTIDIAVISVEPNPTSVTKGENVAITVVVENQGTLDVTSDVKVYYDYMPDFPGQNGIGTKSTENLAAATNKSLAFTWDTTNVKAGNHTITAIVSVVPGEPGANTADNLLKSNKIVTVKEAEIRPLPITELVVAAVVIILVVGAIAFFLRRRRKKPQFE